MICYRLLSVISITISSLVSNMRARVPIVKYLSMVSKVEPHKKTTRFYLQMSNHPIEAGHVLFDDNPRGANNMHILTTLLDYLNAGKSCPKCGSKDSALSQHRGIDYHICSECDNRWIPSSNLPDDFMGTTPVYRPKKEKDEFKGVSAIEVGEAGLLEGWHRKDSECYACRCPVHNGQSVNSMVVFNDGHFYCHMNCDGKEIYRVLKELKKEGGVE